MIKNNMKILNVQKQLNLFIRIASIKLKRVDEKSFNLMLLKFQICVKNLFDFLLFVMNFK